MKLGRLLVLLPLLGGCSLAAVSDRYGNLYGDWYNPGQGYSWQLASCEQQLDLQRVPPPDRKVAMRCCMWRNGVPVDDPQACHAATG